MVTQNGDRLEVMSQLKSETPASPFLYLGVWRKFMFKILEGAGIYCFENLINGKKYIGQSDNLRRRILRHIRELKNNNDSSKILQNAYNKYGEDGFELYLIDECAVELLNEREIYWIKELGSNQSEWGYNISWGGEAFMRGVETTQEHRLHLSLATSGSRNGMYGRPASEASKTATREWAKIRIFTQETRDKISYSNMARKSENASSIYKGVTKDDRNHFIARIHNIYLKKREYIGYYKNEIDAAKAFDKKCWEYYHDLLKLNFPEDYKEENNDEGNI